MNTSLFDILYDCYSHNQPTWVVQSRCIEAGYHLSCLDIEKYREQQEALDELARIGQEMGEY